MIRWVAAEPALIAGGGRALLLQLAHEVTATARALARAVLDGRRLPAYLKPGLPLNRFVTAGLLPPPIRRQYGLAWGPHRERSLALLLRSAGGASHLVPRSVRHRAPELFVRMARHRAGQTVSR